MIWLPVVAWADPAADVARQREIVHRAAEASAEARAEGQRRSVIAASYAAFRAAKLELDRLTALVTPPPVQIDADRQRAVDELRTALAEGARASPARQTVASWLGDPQARLALLAAAIGRVGPAPAGIRVGVLLDVLEQTDALAVWLAFDAAVHAQDAGALELRVASLRRRAPGQTPTMAEELEAVRLTEQVRAELEAEQRLRALLTQVAIQRAAAMRALAEERP